MQPGSGPPEQSSSADPAQQYSHADSAQSSQSEPDDWLADATVAAQSRVALGELDVSFDGANLPDPSDDLVA